MLIDRYTWEVASASIEAERERRVAILLGGGISSMDDYKSHVGFLEGLLFFERMLREARKPQKQEGDD
jgi:hypothetical protein